MKSLFVWLCLSLGVLRVSAADTVRVCTYNLLKFSQTNEDGRVPQFARILDSIRPHILVSQEVLDASAGPRFVTEVFTWAPFAATNFIDGPDSDNQVFYDQRFFDLVSTRVIPTELRNILEVVLALRPHDNTLADTLVVYSVHLKAQDNSADAAQRAREVTALINAMSTRERIIICGDFNIYAPTEVAYTSLVGPSAVRPFIDPLGTSWRRNTASFAKIYSQCTRATNISGCGGGVDGGVDDRFDYILASAGLSSRVIPGSYASFGNDGVPRLNSSISDPPNTLVSAEMAAALLCASDHLPVHADIILGDVQAGVDEWQKRALDIRWVHGAIIATGLTPGEEYRVVSANGAEHLTFKAHAEREVLQSTALASGTYHVVGANAYGRFLVVR